MKFVGSLIVVVVLSGLAGCDRLNLTGPSESHGRLATAGKLPTPTPTPTTTPGPRSRGPLAFVSTRDGASYIYVANSDGSNATKLVAGERPAWSYDGNRLAFQRGSSAAPDIFVINADGSGLRVLGKGASPTWSPDGSRLAVSDGDYLSGISVMNADGSGRTVFVRPGFRAPDDSLLSPFWSPDGQTIGFVAANDYLVNQIYVAPVAGGQPRVLIPEGLLGIPAQRDPAWSPDGSEVVFLHGFTLQTVRADGSGLQSRVSGDAYAVDWGPDGQFVFSRFLSGYGPGSPMRIFAGVGGTAQQLVPDAAGVAFNYWDDQPAWSRR